LKYNALKLTVYSIEERQSRGKPTALWKLPSEIRNKIYKYLLVDEDIVHIKQHQKGLAKHYNLAVLKSCRQMKREADGIFYGHNTFELDAGRLCPPKVESVKVHINEDIDLPDCIQAIQRCAELHSLSVELSAVPTYRRSQKPSTLASLKFKKPSKLTKIEVKLSSSKVSPSEEEDEARAILQSVLENGYSMLETRHHVLVEGHRRSKRIKK
jgi:septum formation topological specificity factor MinE